MEEKYRIQFFKYLYDSLGLKQHEDKLLESNIGSVKGENNMCSEELLCSKISQYFYLLNDVDTDCLTPEEVSYLEGITSETPASDVKAFLERTCQKVLLSQNKPEKVYYGPLNDPNYEADSDSIAIGLKYDLFGLMAGKKKSLEQIEEDEKIVGDIINKIQSNPSFKVKVIVYDELYELQTKNVDEVQLV